MHPLHRQVRQAWEELVRQYNWRLTLDLAAITAQLEAQSDARGALEPKAITDLIKEHFCRRIYAGLSNQEQTAAEDLMLACEQNARFHGVAEEQIADIAAETVRRVIQYLPTIKQPERVLAFAFKILYRLLPTTNQQEIVASDLPPNTFETLGAVTELEEIVAQRLMYAQLLVLIRQKIPNDTQRAVVIRSVFFEETPRDIAADLNLPPEQVRLAKSRGLQRLREDNEVLHLLQSQSIDVK